VSLKYAPYDWTFQYRFTNEMYEALGRARHVGVTDSDPVATAAVPDRTDGADRTLSV
jgi:hypothetical protein